MNKSMSYVRFDKLNIYNYACFAGENEFIFNSKQTIISGKNGTGKTLLMNVLINLGFVSDLNTNSKNSLVKVITQGDRALIKRYAHIIFLECDHMKNNLERLYQYAVTIFEKKNIKTKILNIYNRLVKNQPHKRKSYSTLTPVGMVNSTEKYCLSYAIFFAVRNLHNTNLPLVLDNPFGYLDQETTEAFCKYLDSLDCQKILLVNENNQCDYRLV